MHSPLHLSRCCALTKGVMQASAGLKSSVSVSHENALLRCCWRVHSHPYQRAGQAGVGIADEYVTPGDSVGVDTGLKEAEPEGSVRQFQPSSIAKGNTRRRGNYWR